MKYLQTVIVADKKKMKYLQTFCIRFDNLLRRCEHFSHQSTLSTNTNMGEGGN